MDPAVGLSAFGAVTLGGSAGLRVFLPLFLLSLSAGGVLPVGLELDQLPEELRWLGSDYAMYGFGGCYALERFLYLFPVVDNVSDGVEAFMAPVSGFALSAMMMEYSVPVAEASVWVGGGLPPVLVGGSGFLSMPEGFSLFVSVLAGVVALVFHLILMVARLLANLVASGPVVGVLEDILALIIFVLVMLVAWLAFIVMFFGFIYLVYRVSRSLANWLGAKKRVAVLGTGDGASGSNAESVSDEWDGYLC